MASEETKKRRSVILRCMHGEEYEVERKVAEQSMVIKNIMDDSNDGGEGVIVVPLANVPANVLPTVLEYCEKHANKGDVNLDKWDAEYINVSVRVLYNLFRTADYLHVKGLLQLAARAMADLIKKAKNPEEIRQIFRIENDFTPEEEEKLRAENSWAFSDRRS